MERELITALHTELMLLGIRDIIISPNNNHTLPNEGFLETDLIPLAGETVGRCDSTTILRWIAQITICEPEGTGVFSAFDKVDALRQGFRRGTTITSDGLSFEVIKEADMSPPLIVSGWWKTPVSIRFIYKQ